VVNHQRTACRWLPHTLEEAHTFHLVFADGAFHEAPCVVELGLDGDVRLGEFFLVL